MKTATVAALITSLFVFFTSSATGMFGLMLLGMAFTASPAGDLTVDVSAYVYLGLAIIGLIIVIIAAAFTVKKMINAKNWNPFGATVLCCLVFSVVIGIVHFLSFVIAAAVANSPLF